MTTRTEAGSRRVRPHRIRGAPRLGALLLSLLAVACAADEAGERDEPAAGDAVAPASGPPPGPIRVEDQAGRVVQLSSPPERIVSLVPSATGALLALGQGERLVGRTDFDDDERIAHLPSVGGGLGPVLERLIALEPELVVRFEGVEDRGTPPALERAGIPHLAVRPDRIADTFEMVRLMGAVTGDPAGAEALVGELEEGLAAVRERVAGLPRREVAFLLGGDPPWAVTGGTFLHELLEIAGARNVLEGAGPPGAPLNISVEAVIRAEPELILAPVGATLPGALARIPVRRIPPEVQQPGVGLVRAAEEIARALHPEGGP